MKVFSEHNVVVNDLPPREAVKLARRLARTTGKPWGCGDAVALPGSTSLIEGRPRWPSIVVRSPGLRPPPFRGFAFPVETIRPTPSQMAICVWAARRSGVRHSSALKRAREMIEEYRRRRP